MSSSTKPYLLRALYEWCVDNDQTPHIVAWVNEQTRVPMQYVRDNEIVLNIGPSASHNLIIDNEWVSFSARFGGVSHEVWIPIGHVISLFARESGEGMGFEVEALETEKTPTPEPPHPADAQNAGEKADVRAEQAGKKSDGDKPKKGLKLVK